MGEKSEISTVTSVAKSKARKAVNLAGRYSNMDLVEPGTPKLLSLVANASSLIAKRDQALPGAVYGTTNTVSEFLLHWVENGWKVAELPRLYERLRRVNLIYLVCSAAAGISTAGQFYRVLNTGSGYLTVATGACATLIFLLLAAYYAMHCWRLGNVRINGIGFLNSFRADWRIIAAPRLPSNYLEKLKKAYAEEYRFRHNERGARPPLG